MAELPNGLERRKAIPSHDHQFVHRCRTRNEIVIRCGCRDVPAMAMSDHTNWLSRIETLDRVDVLGKPLPASHSVTR
jgi:hypothetical protein